jgi:hypothetical protein
MSCLHFNDDPIDGNSRSPVDCQHGRTGFGITYIIQAESHLFLSLHPLTNSSRRISIHFTFIFIRPTLFTRVQHRLELPCRLSILD